MREIRAPLLTVFDSEPIQYGEWAYGYAKEHQTIIKLPNLRGVRLQIGDEDSSASEWQIKPIKMTLDLKKACWMNPIK